MYKKTIWRIWKEKYNRQFRSSYIHVKLNKNPPPFDSFVETFQCYRMRDSTLFKLHSIHMYILVHKHFLRSHFLSCEWIVTRIVSPVNMCETWFWLKNDFSQSQRVVCDISDEHLFIFNSVDDNDDIFQSTSTSTMC